MRKTCSLPSVSIVIVTYNKRRILMDCLESLDKSNYENFEVIVVDNGSRDIAESDLGIFSSPPLRQLKIMYFDRNMGFAFANNAGVEISEGKYVFLLNNDTVVDPSCIDELVRTMENDATLGGVQAKLLIPTDPLTIDSMGYVVDRTAWGVSVGRKEIDNGNFEHPDLISYGKGAALFLRKNVIDKTGLFDPDFFFLSEDFDVCWRIWLHGYRIISVPKARVLHRVSSTMSSVSPQVRCYHQSKNLMATLLKNYGFINLALFFGVSVTLHFMYYLSLPSKERVGAVRGFLRALLWVLINMRTILAKRIYVQKAIRRLSDRVLLKVMMSKKFLFVDEVSHFVLQKHK